MTIKLSFEGVFESHITVDVPVDEVAFRRDCDRLCVKPIVISLPPGTTAVQPMTSAIHQGDLDTAMASSTALLRELRLLGYRPVRLKLEAGPRNRDLPETDAGAAELPDT